MTLKGRKVLVIGAGGFIGSHLAENLVEQGAMVRAMVEYNAQGNWGCLESSPVCDELEVYAGDIRDRDNLQQAMQGMETVFHLAALISIPHSYHAPMSYVRTNVEGTLNVLQVALELGVERLIHTSTSEVYGTARYVPIDESHPLQAQSPYSASKISADKLAEAFHLSFDLPVVTVRPFNTFGPRQSTRAVIPTIIAQCLSGGPVHLGNLRPTRDLNYVTNIVDGFVQAASVSEAVGHTINLGSGREISIGELAELIFRLIGEPVKIERDKRRLRPDNSEVERLLADNTLARTLLGWESTVSLEEGLKYTIEWMREHLDAYRPGVYAL